MGFSSVVSPLKQGSNPIEDKVLQNARGLLFVHPFIQPMRTYLRLRMANVKAGRADSIHETIYFR